MCEMIAKSDSMLNIMENEPSFLNDDQVVSNFFEGRIICCKEGERYKLNGLGKLWRVVEHTDSTHFNAFRGVLRLS